MDISECAVTPEGKTEYRCLYRYNITKNEYENGRHLIEGEFMKVNEPSEHLQMLLTRSGVPQDMLQRYLRQDTVGRKKTTKNACCDQPAEFCKNY